MAERADGLTGNVHCIQPPLDPEKGSEWARDPDYLAEALKTAQADPEIAELLYR